MIVLRQRSRFSLTNLDSKCLRTEIEQALVNWVVGNMEQSNAEQTQE
jgi:hypothetical protein